MFLTPNKSKVTYNPKMDMTGHRQGLTFNSGVNTVANDPQYTIYQKDKTYLKVFLNKQGNCERFEENLTEDQTEKFYNQFKRYIPQDK